MAIMGYEEWKRRTKLGLVKPRSESLKILDAALKAYGLAPGSAPYFETLKAAFIAWAEGKQGGAESSERNQNRAVTDLMNQILDFDKKNQPGAHLRPTGLMNDIKQGAKLMGEGKLKPQIKVKLTLGELDNSRGSVLYEEFDSTQIIRAKKAWADAFTCADRAVLAIGKVGKDAAETKRYTDWFGVVDPVRLNKVASELRQMQTAFKTSKITLVNREDIKNHVVNGMDPFGAMDVETNENTYGFVYKHQAGSGYRVIMCNQFLQDPDATEAAQTVYHELTHKVLSTKDICYGKPLCKNLATRQPAQAVTNADNIAYYVVSFL